MILRKEIYSGSSGNKCSSNSDGVGLDCCCMALTLSLATHPHGSEQAPQGAKYGGTHVRTCQLLEVILLFLSCVSTQLGITPPPLLQVFVPDTKKVVIEMMLTFLLR